MMFGAKIINQYRKTTKILFVHRLSNATSVQNNLVFKKKQLYIPWEARLIPSHPVGQKFFAKCPMGWDGMGWDYPIPCGALIPSPCVVASQ